MPCQSKLHLLGRFVCLNLSRCTQAHMKMSSHSDNLNDPHKLHHGLEELGKGTWCLCSGEENSLIKKTLQREKTLNREYVFIFARNCRQLHTIEWHRAQSMCGVLENAGLQFSFQQEYHFRWKKDSALSTMTDKGYFSTKVLSHVLEMELKISP